MPGFDRVVGHEEVITLLRRGLVAGRLSHAYLITGPTGVGRRTLALEIAKALNCLADPADRPCDQCRQCRLIQRGVHPDVRVVKRAPERKAILLKPPPSAPTPQRDYADNVAFIQADAQLRPADGRKKVYLILNAEDLSADAANRLLKSIEEPTPYVHFVLTASDRGAVLPTILSRCQELRLRPVPREALAAGLLDAGVADAEQARELAALAGGRPGWAFAAATDASAVEVHRADVRELRDLLAGTRIERLLAARGLVERWGSQPDSVRATLRSWLAWWRDVLLVQHGLEDRVAHGREGERAALRSTAAQVTGEAAREAVARLQRAVLDLDANVNARLVLDLLALKLPRLRQG